MTVHAFVDESRRGSRYFVAVALAEPRNLRVLRRDLHSLLLPGQREIHFKLEKDRRRRALADSIARLPIEVAVYSRACDRHDEPTRQACLTAATLDLFQRRATRMVIDSRSHRDELDEATLRRLMARHVSTDIRLEYEHVSSGEAMLWIADVAAWCFGAGGEWRKRIAPIVTEEIDLDYP
jgi:hypothetical protein